MKTCLALLSLFALVACQPTPTPALPAPEVKPIARVGFTVVYEVTIEGQTYLATQGYNGWFSLCPKLKP